MSGQKLIHQISRLGGYLRIGKGDEKSNYAEGGGERLKVLSKREGITDCETFPKVLGAEITDGRGQREKKASEWLPGCNGKGKKGHVNQQCGGMGW